MRVITWNINGYRNAERCNQIQELISQNNADIICLQEIKMNKAVLDNYGYYCYYNFAKKKGYSGTMVLTKEEPIKVKYEIGLDRFDEEGRFILLEYNKFIIINIYIPHGGRDKKNHPYKFAVIDKLLKLVQEINKPLIICTDFNIAHTEKDVRNYKTNYNNNMFTYEERTQIDKLLSLGLVDSFRCINDSNDIYSMWPNTFHARERNMGWRIDYIFISKSLEKRIKEVIYLRHQLGSDHCPYMLDII